MAGTIAPGFTTPRLVLASQSPRRRELLTRLGIALEVCPAHADESALPGEAPRAYVLRVAREKARAVGGDIVLAADTAVVLGGALIGKPRDREDASRMLRALSGNVHQVLTAVCVRRHDPELELDTLVATKVRFARLSPGEIEWYLATGEPLDKAGAYALQGSGAAFVLSVEGSVSNVIGLPLAETADLLRRAGFPLFWRAAARRAP